MWKTIVCEVIFFIITKIWHVITILKAQPQMGNPLTPQKEVAPVICWIQQAAAKTLMDQMIFWRATYFHCRVTIVLHHAYTYLQWPFFLANRGGSSKDIFDKACPGGVTPLMYVQVLFEWRILYVEALALKEM